jgi:hypothetical protein
VLGMGQESNDAAAKDVQITLRKEEFALGMEQRLNRNDAAVMGVQIEQSVGECAKGTELIAIHKMNLLHLDQNLNLLLQLKPKPISSNVKSCYY